MAFTLIYLVAGVFYLVSCHPEGNRQEDFDVTVNHSIAIDKASFIASLHLGYGSLVDSYLCSAIIVHEKFIVTAASCIDSTKDKKDYKIVVGSDNLNEGSEKIDVEDIIIHGKYVYSPHGYDICLIKLAKAISFSSKVNQIRFLEEDVIIEAGTKLNVTGWFRSESQELSPKFLQKEVHMSNETRCQSACALNSIDIQLHSLCTEYLQQDTVADLGTALTKQDILVGFTSIVHGCGKQFATYTKVADFSWWLKFQMMRHTRDFDATVNFSTTIDNAPFIASLHLGNGSLVDSYLCSAIIVHEKFVVTTASCINRSIDKNDYKIVVGSDNLNEESEKIYVEDIIIHGKYVYSPHGYDICLIKLAKAISFSSKVNQIRFLEENVVIDAETKMNITGWFRSESQGLSPKFLQKEVHMSDETRCLSACALNAIDIQLHSLCTEYMQQDTIADLGTALTKQDVLVGFTSMVQGCGRQFATYTKVADFIGWLKFQIERHVK